MEQGAFEDDEPKLSCVEHCPYLLYGEAQPQPMDSAAAIGALCVTDPDLDYNLRAYQVRGCEGATTWNEDTGTIYCTSRSQVFGKGGEPMLRINSENKEMELLQRHHAGRWERAAQEATRRFKVRILGHIRDVATGVYSQDEIALARIDAHHDSFATKQSHPDLSRQERNEISEKMKRLKDASDAVTYYDRYWELHRQGRTFREVIEAMLVESIDEIDREAKIDFRFELHQLSKKWF